MIQKRLYNNRKRGRNRNFRKLQHKKQNNQLNHRKSLKKNKLPQLLQSLKNKKIMI
jgi:hypothetical protein